MSAVPTERVASALAQIGELGPYFRLAVGDRGGGVHLTEYLDQRERVRERLDAVGRRLGSTEPRVAASSLQYELAERLWAVTLGLWCHHGIVLDLRDVRLAPDVLTRVDLGVAAPRADRVTGDATAPLAAEVLARLSELHAALRAVVPMADGLLWGNAATALVLAHQRIRPAGARGRAAAAVTAMLGRPPLRGWVSGPIDGTIRRRSCCLYYRSGDPRPCPDCPLVDAVVTQRFARTVGTT